ncbi:IS30 family transposase [Patescibacteria group bacterium]|nr:IS30 family transposase [Patescibacteria group bacterium]
MKYTHFTKDLRNELAILLKRDKYELQEIADILGKDPSSIGREIKRNSVNGEYDPKKAHHKAYVKRKYSKFQGMKISSNNNLEKYIEDNIQEYWSPEELAGRWSTKDKIAESNGETVTITHPLIYKYLYKRRPDLCQYLRSKQEKVKKRKGSKKTKKSIIPNIISIHVRPEKVNQRKSFGHWEGDTLGRIKTDKDVIAGLVERQSRYLLIDKLPGLKHTVDGFNDLLNPHHDAFCTLTLDRGVENIRYEELGKPTYFCDLYSSLNNRPMKCLNWNTPKEVFEELISVKRAKIKHTN